MPWLKVYTLLVVEDEDKELYIDRHAATILDEYSYGFGDVEVAGRAYNNAEECIRVQEDQDC